MAHTRDLHDLGCAERHCNKVAVVEVFDRWNGSRGRYCRNHGDLLAANLTAAGA